MGRISGRIEILCIPCLFALFGCISARFARSSTTHTESRQIPNHYYQKLTFLGMARFRGQSHYASGSPRASIFQANRAIFQL